MASKPARPGVNCFLLRLMVTGIFLLYACGGHSSNESSSSDTGALSFSIAYQGAGGGLQPQAAVIDCTGEGIATVEAAIYDTADVWLAGGGPWACDTGSGTITSVPAGGDRTALILGKDTAENVIFRGEKQGIAIDANSENNAGTIDCYSFTPHLQAPADGAAVNADAMSFSWSAVTGASQYRVIVSANSNLSVPVIDETVTTENFLPTGLAEGQTCYWQVVAGDSYTNKGVGSSIWSFTIDKVVHVNTPPVAQIITPVQGSTYTTADTITFTGSGNDSEDGVLSDEALEWRSDIDGNIGTGETFSTDLLSEGSHQITLTATDSEEATGTDTVTITITLDPSPTAQITSPAQGSTFSQFDNIEFRGTAIDSEGRYLASLVWRSDIDGNIGEGTSFTTTALSVGTHQITLTATDSLDATGTDSITITVNPYGPPGITTLDSAGDVGMYSAIAVEDGKIFIAYYDETNQTLKVARSLLDGSGWSISGGLHGIGKGSSIAIDGDNVFISTAYPLFSDWGLYYYGVSILVSNNNGDSWSTSDLPIDDSATGSFNYEFSSSIVADGQNIYVACLSEDLPNMNILKSTYSHTDWTTLEIPPPSGEEAYGYSASMVQNRNILYISHSGYSKADIYLTEVANTLSDPVTTLVAQAGVAADKGYTASSFGRAADGAIMYEYVNTAYFDQSDGNHDLKFARRKITDSQYDIITIDNSSEVIGKYPSMIFTNGKLYVSYYDESNGNLKIAIASDNGDSWDVYTVDDSTDDVGRYTSLAVNGPKVYISYYDATNKDLKYAKSIDGGLTWK